MAKFKITHPEALLGRTVKGAYFCGAHLFRFHGMVEAVVIPAAGTDHQFEFFVGGEYVSMQDCQRIEVV